MSKFNEDPWKMFWTATAFLIMMITVLLLSSCGSSRKTTRNDIEHNISMVEENNKVITGTSITGLNQVIEKHQIGKLNFVLYDTSKPPDKETGKPPILAEGNAEITSDTNIHNKFNKNDSIGVVSSAKKNIDDQKKDNSIIEKEKKESTLPKQIGFMLIGLSILIISCVASWLVYKKKKKK